MTRPPAPTPDERKAAYDAYVESVVAAAPPIPEAAKPLIRAAFAEARRKSA